MARDDNRGLPDVVGYLKGVEGWGHYGGRFVC